MGCGRNFCRYTGDPSGRLPRLPRADLVRAWMPSPMAGVERHGLDPPAEEVDLEWGWLHDPGEDRPPGRPHGATGPRFIFLHTRVRKTQSANERPSGRCVSDLFCGHRGRGLCSDDSEPAQLRGARLFSIPSQAPQRASGGSPARRRGSLCRLQPGTAGADVSAKPLNLPAFGDQRSAAGRFPVRRRSRRRCSPPSPRWASSSQPGSPAALDRGWT
jgi:hypothetical protein